MSASRRLDEFAGATDWERSEFERNFLAHFTRVVSVIQRLLGDRSRAEELANEAFLKLYRQPVLPESEGNVAGWLYRTATNLAIDELRARNKRKRYEEQAERLATRNELESPLDELLREEQRGRVRKVLAALKPAQAQILILRHSGFSYNELAACLGVKRGSVGTMLLRAEAEFQRRYLLMKAEEIMR